ncbi:MAG TPA: hypothetical protein VMU08_08295 [Rhizomicrobium sp.]|nr:hypothetical protein [Rhizomicrobium sp.]
MSQPSFAPITSNLLVRKGLAAPSLLGTEASLHWMGESKEPSRAVVTPLPRRDDGPLVAPDSEPLPPPPPAPRTAAASTPPMPPDGSGGKPHKIMVTLTPAEFERLGIAAVKKGVTRHQIVRHALDLHLEELKREYGGCGCMATGGCTQDCGAV